MPNLIPDWLPWMRPAGRLIWSIVLLLIVPGDHRSRLMRRPEARPARDVGRVHGRRGRRLRADDARLRGHPARVDHLLRQVPPVGHRPSSWCAAARRSSSSSSRSTSTMQAISDIVAVGIYVVFFGLNLVAVRHVAEARAGEARGRGGEAADLALRPSAAAPAQRAGRPRARRRTVVTPDGPHRRQPADARLRHRLRAAGGRPVAT